MQEKSEKAINKKNTNIKKLKKNLEQQLCLPLLGMRHHNHGMNLWIGQVGKCSLSTMKLEPCSGHVPLQHLQHVQDKKKLLQSAIDECFAGGRSGEDSAMRDGFFLAYGEDLKLLSKGEVFEAFDIQVSKVRNNNRRETVGTPCLQCTSRMDDNIS